MIRAVAIAAAAILAAGPTRAQEPDRSTTGHTVQALFSAYLEASIQAMYAMPDATPDGADCRDAFWAWQDATRATEDRIETYLILDARITDPVSRTELQAYFASRDQQLSINQLVYEAQVREACTGRYTFIAAFDTAVTHFIELKQALQVAPE